MSEGSSAKQMARVARCFDAAGRLQRWPSKRSDQVFILWVVWWQLPSGTQMNEVELRGLLKGWHDYEDHVLLRRELVDLDLLRRTPDGKIYVKMTRDMPQDAERLATSFG